jgi:hypothetical protein
MKEYLLLLRAGRPMSSKSDAENQAENEAWGVYMGTLAQGGNLVGGLPLQSGGHVVSAKGAEAEPAKTVAGDIIGGYLILKANDMAHAVELAKGCPHIDNEGNIEVRELAPMPAM